jgi:TRAP-type C4-dicarboxylate transport system substrate-binding protein
MNKSKLRFLGYMHRGPRYLTTTSRIIHEPNDLLGLKLRVPELPVYIKSWKAFGANPTPIPYSDIFMALKQGVVDGQENPLEVIYTSHLYETQHYIMRTRHLIGFYIIVVGEKFYEKFSNKEQVAIQDAVDEAISYQNSIVNKYEQFYIEKLENYGVKFIDVDRKSFEYIAKKKLPVEFKDVWAPQIFERITQVK